MKAGSPVAMQFCGVQTSLSEPLVARPGRSSTDLPHAVSHGMLDVRDKLSKAFLPLIRNTLEVSRRAKCELGDESQCGEFERGPGIKAQAEE